MEPASAGTSNLDKLEPTPLAWRLSIALAILVLGGLAYVLQATIGSRGVAVLGIVCFIGLAALCSSNLRAVNWHTIAWGFGLQLGLALFILKLEVFGVRPGYELFNWAAQAVEKFLAFTSKGSEFVFGPLANREVMDKIFGGRGFVFAFRALPTIIFVSSFFTILYYFGILQWVVRLMAKAMMYLMRTSGAETLSAAANVFMGQTEAPLIVKPYVPRMTRSELLCLMVGGMATVSGGIMGVYLELGADALAMLTTSVMAAPCALYLSKLILPELDEPITRGGAKIPTERQHVNVIDAAAGGASDGLGLALNVAAMLIAFLAFIAMVNYLLGLVSSDLSLERIFSYAFAPVAFLMGVNAEFIPGMADLLGTKLIANEVVAYVSLKDKYTHVFDERTRILATYALTGFANISSIGIQLGGIGAMAPTRRADLAQLGTRALLAGFLATLINATIAGLLL